MAKRTIEEAFHSIRPQGQKGIPAPPVPGVSVSSTSGDLSASLSQAGQQIARLQNSYQQQAALIIANTQAILNNTSSHSQSTASTIAHAASGFLGGGLGLLSPLISGLTHLFGGGGAPVALPLYTAPAPVSINAGITSGSASGSASGYTSAAPPVTPLYVPPVQDLRGATAQASGVSQPGAASGSGSAPQAPQITVNVNAMDSQSFMDRSSDIANAVREAMLNMHPINEVIASL